MDLHSMLPGSHWHDSSSVTGVHLSSIIPLERLGFTCACAFNGVWPEWGKWNSYRTKIELTKIVCCLKNENLSDKNTRYTVMCEIYSIWRVYGKYTALYHGKPYFQRHHWCCILQILLKVMWLPEKFLPAGMYCNIFLEVTWLPGVN